MSDNSWRRKNWYTPRVVIATQDVLASPFPDALVCLTGKQLAILRNLMQYAHRRSTFVSEYCDDYYLAPTNEEWDDLQAVVDDLEDTLMGCEEYTQLLEDIRAATQCACDQLTAMPKEAWPSGGILPGQPDYDDYTSPVIADEGDPPGALPTWDDWHDYVCKAAQHVFDDATDLAAKLELWYSTGAAITFSVFQTLVIGTAVAPPVALVLVIVELLLIFGTALSVNAVEEWIDDHKQALVCAIFQADTVEQAITDISGVLGEFWDLVLPPQFFWSIINRNVISSIFDVTVPAYEEWEGEYNPAYCGDCEGIPEWFFKEFPPCPGTWTWTAASCDDGYVRLYSTGTFLYSPAYSMPVGSYNVNIRVLYKSNAPSGWDCCYMSLRRSTDGGSSYVQQWNQVMKSNPPNEWITANSGWRAVTVTNSDHLYQQWFQGQQQSYYTWIREVETTWVPV